MSMDEYHDVLSKYMNDWQQRNESMKNGKLKTYLALKPNFGLEKYLTILNNFHYERSICRLQTNYKTKLEEKGCPIDRRTIKKQTHV
jgi:hypothetical protein